MAPKTWLSTKLLDLAENLPETRRGPLHHLQLVRSHQRRRADPLTPRTSPPSGSRLSLSMIRLAEAYSIEHFDRLRRTLQRLFPGRPRHHGYNNLSDLDQSLRSLTASSWWRIGTLLRDRDRYIDFGPVSTIPTLPAQVDHVEVAVHHILPSVAVLAFDVHLTDRAADDLNEVQASPYLSDVTFQSFLRWGAYSEVPAESIRQRRVRDHVDCLRGEIEGGLKRYLRPGLFAGNHKRAPQLPAVELYRIDGDADFCSKEWTDSARSWLESYGMALGIASYQTERACFQWPVKGRSHVPVSGHMLLISSKRYLAHIGDHSDYSNPNDAILYHVRSALLDGLVPVMVITRLLGRARTATEELRERVFCNIEAGNVLSWLRRPTLPAHLHTELLGQSIFVSRLKAEFLREEQWLANRSRQWRDLVPMDRSAEGTMGLDSAALRRIHFDFEMVQTHLDLAQDAFSRYYAARNTRAIFLLTIAILVFTVVQVAASLDWRSLRGAVAALLGGS